jgi:hypothetical protein
MMYIGVASATTTKGFEAANKVPFVAAVSLNKEGHPMAMNMSVVKGFRLTEIAHWQILSVSGQSRLKYSDDTK